VTAAQLYIGLMSGTSLDGVDGVLADFSDAQVRVLAHAERPLPPPLRDAFHALNAPGDNELHRAALAGNALARLYNAVIQELLERSATPRHRIAAVGAHGQTVRHLPRLDGGIGYTLQINQAALLAELCGIDVIADFRSRDVAAGGQGAPLVPPFHQAVFGAPGQARAVLNLGGIANLTLLPADPDTALRGFDCGPANTLLDLWCRRHTGLDFDADGAWARAGAVHADLLAAMQTEPFFQINGPKSTGRDLFNAAWLHRHLERFGAIAAQDVQATLAELSAWSVAEALEGDPAHAVIVCGGGVRNGYLMGRLSALMPQRVLTASDAWGLPAQQVEAGAFAWLAYRHDKGLVGSNPYVTGAREARILGARYPAGAPGSTLG
jgi:anhydro-N-acetylmuramic acid kinase